MSRLLSFLLAYIGANVIYYSFFNPLPFASWKAFFYTFLGDQAAVLTTSPIFWVILILLYFTFRGQWVFMKNQ